jgi:hypothetical protein
VQAFVCFEGPEEARRACQKDRETFSEKWGDRYVRVYPTLESDVADMQQAVLQQNMTHTTVRFRAAAVCRLAAASMPGSCRPPARRSSPRSARYSPSRSLPPTLTPLPQGGHSHHMDSVIKMKSLPFDASQLDIITFFEGFKLKPNGVQLVVRSDNKPTGEVRTDRSH